MTRQDGNTVRTQRTRARILDESLKLFNERGEAAVSTGDIAGALGISPGNLYYHFRNKDQIVAELFGRLESRLDIEPPASVDVAQSIEDLWLYLHLMLEAIWDFRFFYRNLHGVARRDRRLRERFNAIAARKLAAIERLCAALAGLGALRASGEEMHALARNVLLVATYWLDFQALRSGRDEDVDLGQGAFQVMSLVSPYLVGDARRHLERLGRSYVE
ncbi:MAG TPA: TetR/AcrR family transcriptional regulator [Usitatibacter sp.]|nr:TetR/AcrR family transcriptional regulator [Usitatibacter sp.]